MKTGRYRPIRWLFAGLFLLGGPLVGALVFQLASGWIGQPVGAPLPAQIARVPWLAGLSAFLFWEALGGLVFTLIIRSHHAALGDEGRLRKSVKDLEDLKYAVDQAVLVVVTDRRGTIRYANEKFCQISGYSSAELLGQTHRLVNSGYHPRAFFADLWDNILAARVWRGEIRNRAKSGQYYWVDTTIIPSLGADGRPERFLAIRTDILNRRRARSAWNSRQTFDAREIARHRGGNQVIPWLSGLRFQHDVVALTAKFQSPRNQLQDQAWKARIAHHEIRSASQHEHGQVLISRPAQSPDHVLACCCLAKETRRPTQLESGQRRQGNIFTDNRRQACSLRDEAISASPNGQQVFRLLGISFQLGT